MFEKFELVHPIASLLRKFDWNIVCPSERVQSRAK